MNSRRSALIVLNTAHVALGETLIQNEENLGSHLSTQEGGFFGTVAARCGTGTCAGPRSVAVTLVLEIGEVLWESQGLDRGWGLRVAGRAVMGGHIRIHARCAWNGHTVLVVSGVY